MKEEELTEEEEEELALEEAKLEEEYEKYLQSLEDNNDTGDYYYENNIRTYRSRD